MNNSADGLSPRFSVYTDGLCGGEGRGMWPSFVIAVVVAAALLYVPGSLALRGTGLSAPLSVAAAPFVSVFLYAAVGIVLKAAGVVTSWVTLLAIALVLAGIAYALSRVRGGGEALALGPSRTSSRAGWLVLACYVAVGVLVGFCCFLSVMDGPESFPRQIDTAFHLARIRAYAESGTFSVLDVTNYPDGMEESTCRLLVVASATGMCAPRRAEMYSAAPGRR